MSTRFVRPRETNLFHVRGAACSGSDFLPWNFAEQHTNAELAQMVSQPHTVKPCKRCKPLEGPDKPQRSGDPA